MYLSSTTLLELLKIIEIQSTYRGLLSSSCGGLKPLAASEGPKGDFGGHMDEQTDRRTTGLRDLDVQLFLVVFTQVDVPRDALLETYEMILYWSGYKTLLTYRL